MKNNWDVNLTVFRDWVENTVLDWTGHSIGEGSTDVDADGDTDDGSVVCWGDRSWGQSDLTTSTFLQITAGSRHTCGVKTNGQLDCWGHDMQGQSTPPSGKFEQISAGERHTCGVKTDGTVTCWGQDIFGQSTPP